MRAGDVERTGALTSSAHNEILQVGANTGEAEKDTLGYLHTAAAP